MEFYDGLPVIPHALPEGVGYIEDDPYETPQTADDVADIDISGRFLAAGED